MDSAGPRRVSLKAHHPDWKSEVFDGLAEWSVGVELPLRTNCLRRVRKDRTDLLWKIRKQGLLPANDMEKVESAVRNIISDEIEKLKQSNEGKEDQEMDSIWEYQGPQSAKPAEIESEDILLEMERLLYEDIREELIRKQLEALDEEDAYLAQIVFEHMQLNDNEIRTLRLWYELQTQANTDADLYQMEHQGVETNTIQKITEQHACQHEQKNAAETAKLWCPVCKRGDLRETHNLIYCTLCKLRLDLGEDKMTLEFLRERLANAHTDHFDRGCKSAPKFCLQTMFGLTALYIQCEECNTFDIVV